MLCCALLRRQRKRKLASFFKSSSFFYVLQKTYCWLKATNVLLKLKSEVFFSSEKQQTVHINTVAVIIKSDLSLENIQYGGYISRLRKSKHWLVAAVCCSVAELKQ